MFLFKKKKSYAVPLRTGIEAVVGYDPFIRAGEEAVRRRATGIRNKFPKQLMNTSI